MEVEKKRAQGRVCGHCHPAAHLPCGDRSPELSVTLRGPNQLNTALAGMAHALPPALPCTLILGQRHSLRCHQKQPLPPNGSFSPSPEGFSGQQKAGTFPTASRCGEGGSLPFFVTYPRRDVTSMCTKGRVQTKMRLREPCARLPVTERAAPEPPFVAEIMGFISNSLALGPPGRRVLAASAG